MAPCRNHGPRGGNRWVPRSVALAAALVVAGCSDPTGLFIEDEPPPPCPRVSVLADAATQVVFRPGPGRDLTDVDYEGRVSDVKTACEYEFEDDLPVQVTVQIGIVVTATRGPANKDHKGEFTYFVALADADRRVVEKNRFPLVAPFPGNRTAVIVTDIDPPVTLDIPLGEGRNGPDYEIFVGLQLTPEQVEFNRRQRARSR